MLTRHHIIFSSSLSLTLYLDKEMKDSIVEDKREKYNYNILKINSTLHETFLFTLLYSFFVSNIPSSH
jgi:hypothetical protein